MSKISISLSPKAQAALVWITNLLGQYHIPYQIAGGFAALIYGSNRELIDIDIDIPEESFKTIYAAVKDYIIFGPAQFQSENWDLLLMTLNYHGQEIDLGGAYQTRIFNQKVGQWEELTTDFSKVNYVTVSNLFLPFITLEELIAYKKKLGRPVDLIDVANLQR